MPETTTFPGRQAELMFAPLDALGFPVDACFSARWIPNEAALALVRRRIVDADHAFDEESRGDHGPTSRTAARPDLVRDLEQELTASDRPPLLRGQLSYALAARSHEELEECVRALRRELARAVPPVVLGDRLEAVAELFDVTHIIPLTDAVIAAAAALPPPVLRSLDAIHLASAQAAELGARPTVVCGYDRRLQQSAIDHRLLAISPA